MSQALLKKFRRAGQGSREQKEIVRRAKNDIRTAKMYGNKPSETLQTIIKEYKPETKEQLKSKAWDARMGALGMAGGPAAKGGVKLWQLGRSIIGGLPSGITKVKGGFKVGKKVYKTLGAAKSAKTRAAKLKATKVIPPIPKGGGTAGTRAAATRGGTTARQRPNKNVRRLRRNERQQLKPTSPLKRAIVPATAVGIGVGSELLRRRTKDDKKIPYTDEGIGTGKYPKGKRKKTKDPAASGDPTATQRSTFVKPIKVDQPIKSPRRKKKEESMFDDVEGYDTGTGRYSADTDIKEYSFKDILNLKSVGGQAGTPKKRPALRGWGKAERGH